MTGMPTSGDQIGPYQVTAVLGFTERGGVFSAWHTATQREVALAVLQPGLVGDAEARRQFFAEVKDLARVRHENLVEVLDVVEDAPAPWFAVELLRGIPLAEFVRRAGRLPLGAALHIAWQLCQGLRAAHETGLVHRALRMDSLFLVEQGGAADVVKVLGFQSGSPVDIEAAWPGIAPEQWRDEFVDHRADFYSLGALLYELTTGRRALQGQTRDELRASHERASVVPPSTFSMTMPPALDALIVQCLAKDPEDRPYMIQEIESALREVASEVSPYQQNPVTGEGAAVAIPGPKGWTVVAVPARTPTWTASSPPARAAVEDEPESLDEADIADLEDAEPLATPWPAQLPVPPAIDFAPPPVSLGSSLPAPPAMPATTSPTSARGGLADLADLAAATTGLPPSAAPAAPEPAASLFGDMGALVPGDLLADIAAAVDDATETPAPGPSPEPPAPEPAPRASVFDMFADAAPLTPQAPGPPPATATFDLVEQAPVLDLPIPQAPLLPATPTVAPLAPFVSPVVAPVVAVAPALDEPGPSIQPALRPAMGPRGGAITAVPGAVVAPTREPGPIVGSELPPVATTPAPPTPAPLAPVAATPFVRTVVPPTVEALAPPSFDAPAPRSKLPYLAAAAAVVVIVIGAVVVMGGGDDAATTVAVAEPAPAPAPPEAAPVPPPAPAPAEAVVVIDAGVADAVAVDAGVDAPDAVIADAGVADAAVAVAAATPTPVTGDGFGFPDEPGNAPPPPPPSPPATATKPKPAPKPVSKPVSKPAPPKPAKPVVAPAPKPKPKPPTVSKDTLKDGGLVNPFKRK